MVDIGVNLSGKQFDGDRRTILDHAYSAGLYGIITISNSVKESSKNVALLDEFVNHDCKLWCTIGVHPHDAKSVKESDWELLENLIRQNKNVVAVGECGLDYNRIFSPPNVQREVFARQLELAHKMNKPVYLHDREATDDMLKILDEFKKKYNLPKINGVIHCFTNTIAVMKKYLELGLSIGITGWICDTRRNQDLVIAVKSLALDRLLIETDSPYLTPPDYASKWKTRRNEPDSLDYVVQELSKHMNKTVDEIYKQTMTNTKALFKIEF